MECIFTNTYKYYIKSKSRSDIQEKGIQIFKK